MSDENTRKEEIAVFFPIKVVRNVLKVFMYTPIKNQSSFCWLKSSMMILYQSPLCTSRELNSLLLLFKDANTFNISITNKD